MVNWTLFSCAKNPVPPREAISDLIPFMDAFEMRGRRLKRPARCQAEGGYLILNQWNGLHHGEAHISSDKIHQLTSIVNSSSNSFQITKRVKQGRMKIELSTHEDVVRIELQVGR